MERGVIENTKRAQQINDFSGLRYGHITPTDIDGLIEYKDKGYVILEVKYNGKELPYGQRLAIERITKDVAYSGKAALALIADHYVADTDSSVDVASCNVREIYYSRERAWRKPKRIMTVREITDKFLKTIV